MPFISGISLGNLDPAGNVVTSADLIIANQRFLAEGFTGTCSAGAEEYSSAVKIQENGSDVDVGIFGLKFTCSGHQFGDYARMELVDVDNVLGYGAGLVLGNFGQRFYIPHDGVFEIALDFKKVVPGGLYFRLRYTADAAGSQRKYVVNLYLVKVD